MLVKATNKYEELQVKDKQLNRIPKEGETFTINKARFKELTETNRFNVTFVEKVEINENRKNTDK